MSDSVEQGDPLAGLEGFRRSLGEFATGVTVITTNVGGANFGMTSNSFSSVSLEPPLVLWSIRRASQSFSAFEACSHFAVNVLASDQMDLSQRFAKSDAEKFDGVCWTRGKGDVPLLSGVAASFECHRTAAVEGGDHVIYLGHVDQYCRYERQLLLFAKGRYAVAADHPDTRVLSSATDTQVPLGLDEQVLSLLMVRAYSAIAARLEQGRKSVGLGLSLMQARLLKAVHTRPQSTLEAMLPELFLEFNASRHVLESVIELGLLTIDEAGTVTLTPDGEARILAVIEHARENERLLFKSISKQDLAVVQRALSKIIADLS